MLQRGLPLFSFDCRSKGLKFSNLRNFRFHGDEKVILCQTSKDVRCVKFTCAEKTWLWIMRLCFFPKLENKHCRPKGMYSRFYNKYLYRIHNWHMEKAKLWLQYQCGQHLLYPTACWFFLFQMLWIQPLHRPFYPAPVGSIQKNPSTLHWGVAKFRFF